MQSPADGKVALLIGCGGDVADAVVVEMVCGECGTCGASYFCGDIS